MFLPFFIAQATTLNWNGAPALTLNTKAGRHVAQVQLGVRNFEPGSRDLGWRIISDDGKSVITRGKAVKESGYYPIWFEGKKVREFYGHDGGYGDDVRNLTTGQWMRKHFTELSKFLVKVDGKEWTVGRRLYGDILNLPLTDENVVLLLAADGRTLTITSGGSDGAGGYGVIWTLRRDGRHSRKILQGD